VRKVRTDPGLGMRMVVDDYLPEVIFGNRGRPRFRLVLSQPLQRCGVLGCFAQKQ
jgi:hypothetical protein